MTKTLRNTYAFGLLIGTLAIAGVPAVLYAQGQIVCDKCVCNLQTGQCECTGCRVEPT